MYPTASKHSFSLNYRYALSQSVKTDTASFLIIIHVIELEKGAAAVFCLLFRLVFQWSTSTVKCK